MNGLLNDLEKHAITLNKAMTEARATNPDLMGALDKVKAAESAREKIKASSNKTKPMIKKLERRVDKNRSRYEMAKDMRDFQNQANQYGKKLGEKSRIINSTYGPPASQQNMSLVHGRQLVQANVDEYKKRYDIDPDGIKNINRYEKNLKRSKDLLERQTLNAASSSKDLSIANKDRAFAGEQYRELRRGRKFQQSDTKAKSGVKSIEQQKEKKLRQINNKAIGAGLAGVGAVAGGAYLYNRYKKKKRAEQEEKTAWDDSLLNDLEKHAKEEKTAGMLDSLLNRNSNRSYDQLARRQRLDGYIAKALTAPKPPSENSYKKIKLPTK